MKNQTNQDSTRGLILTLGAYLTWGLFPLYWVPLAKVPEFEVLSHRVIWSFAILFGILLIRRNWSWLPKLYNDKRLLAWLALSSLVLTINWILFIWAASNGHILDASLGYFINPLVSVLLGYILLGERLSKAQKISISLAALGVIWLVWQNGHMPWLALGLAISFGLYGFFRKVSRLPSIEGLVIEMLFMLPFAFGYLLFCHINGVSHFASGNLSITVLLAGTGIVTVIPLLLFASGVPKVSMITLGLTQYIAPSCQFLIGVWFLHEPMNNVRLIGFALIWAALLVYTYSGLRWAFKYKTWLAKNKSI